MLDKSKSLIEKVQRDVNIFFLIGLVFSTAFFGTLNSQPTRTIAPGAVVINMGIVPQTIANGLKPYGLVYNLIDSQKVPVLWSIEPTKAKDSADFTVDGIKFKGGTFVIEYQYAKLAKVQAALSAYATLGVIKYTTLTTVTIPVYKELKVFPSYL